MKTEVIKEGKLSIELDKLEITDLENIILIALEYHNKIKSKEGYCMNAYQLELSSELLKAIREVKYKRGKQL